MGVGGTLPRNPLQIPIFKGDNARECQHEVYVMQLNLRAMELNLSYGTHLRSNQFDPQNNKICTEL